jgi:hypothetical protein
MPHPFPAALQTALAGASHREAHLVKMTLDDGTIIAMTDWDQPLTVDLDGGGAIAYSPVNVQSLSAFSAQINTPIDDAELAVMIDGSTFTADKVRAETFAGAAVTVGIVNPSDLANPAVHRVYDVGQTRIEGLTVRFELMGMERRLEQPAGRSLTATCPWRFGSAECGIALDVAAWAATTVYVVGDEVKPTAAGALGWFRCIVAGTSAGSEPAWPGSGDIVDNTVTWTFFKARRATGTVSGVTDSRVFAATGISVAADHFAEGLLTWTTGANAGQTRRVRADSGGGGITLHIPALSTIAVSDTFTIVAGCRKRLAEDCIAKHANALASSSQTLRFGGFPFLTPEDVTLTAEKTTTP